MSRGRLVTNSKGTPNQALQQTGSIALLNLSLTQRRKVGRGVADISNRASAPALLEQKLRDVSLLLVQDQAARIRLHRELGTLEVHDDAVSENYSSVHQYHTRKSLSGGKAPANQASGV